MYQSLLALRPSDNGLVHRYVFVLLLLFPSVNTPLPGLPVASSHQRSISFQLQHQDRDDTAVFLSSPLTLSAYLNRSGLSHKHTRPRPEDTRSDGTLSR